MRDFSFTIMVIKLICVLKDPDKTEKFVFHDGLGILEIVRINTKEDRDIFCIPSMYECRLGCTICYLTINNITASSKKVSYDSIKYCIDYIRQNYPTGKNGIQLSLMGVGDPILNMNLVKDLSASDWVTRLSVATIFPFVNDADGLFPDNVKIHYSLHSPLQEKRLKILPNAKVNPENIIAYLDRHHKGDKEIHYTLVEGENDSDEELQAMCELIPAGFTVKFLDFKTSYKSNLSKSNKLEKWIKELEKCGINTEFYYPPGEQIQGSCGLFTEGFYKKEFDPEFRLYLNKYAVYVGDFDY